MAKEWVDDPEPGDMDDPEYRNEIFETFKFMGDKPEDIKDPETSKQYAEWLKEQK